MVGFAMYCEKLLNTLLPINEEKIATTQIDFNFTII